MFHCFHFGESYRDSPQLLGDSIDGACNTHFNNHDPSILQVLATRHYPADRRRDHDAGFDSSLTPKGGPMPDEPTDDSLGQTIFLLGMILTFLVFMVGPPFPKGP